MFKFAIVYRKGSKHGKADAMSRLSTEIDGGENEDDEPSIIYTIITGDDKLSEEQMSHSDLKWFCELKQLAELENKHHIVVLDFQNRTQRSLYAQWNGIHLINGVLYRGGMVKRDG